MKNILFILPILFSLNVLAAPKINNLELSNILVEAKLLFDDKSYFQAAEKILEAINTENENAKNELNKLLEYQAGPLKLFLYNTRLWYLKKACLEKAPAFSNEVQTVINKYSNEAKDKDWNSYKRLYIRLAEHHKANKNDKGVAHAHEARFMYSPIDKVSLMTYLKYLFEKDFSKVNSIITQYESAGGTEFPRLSLLKCKIIKKQGGDVFKSAIGFLKAYPTSKFKDIRAMIVMARDALTADKPEQIKEYYNILAFLAIKQPSDKKHLETVGFILNERKKIEAILPEIRK